MRLSAKASSACLLLQKQAFQDLRCATRPHGMDFVPKSRHESEPHAAQYQSKIPITRIGILLWSEFTTKLEPISSAEA